MTTTTFGTSSKNPFVINTFSGGSVVANIGVNTTSTSTANTTNPTATNGTNGTSGTPQISLPSTVYPIGVPLANGIIVEYSFGNPGKQLIQCRNAAGVSFTVNGAQFEDTAALESIPAGIISQIKPDTLIGKFADSFDSNPYNGVGGFPDKLPAGFPIPLVNGQPVKMILWDPSVNGEPKWYGYAPISYTPNGTWDAEYVRDMYGVLDSQPTGLNTGRIRFQNNSFSVAPTSFSQMFSNYASAQAYQVAHPGSTLTDKSYTIQTPYPGGPQFGANLQNLLASGTWKAIGDPILKTVIEDQQFNIQEGSPEYNKFVNTLGYTPVFNGNTKQIQLTPPIPGQNFDDKTEAEIKALQDQYPGLKVTPDGFFTTNTTIPGGESYNNGAAVAVGSALYNELISKGWTAKPANSIFTPNPDKITNQTGLSQAAKDALDPNVWKVIKSYPGPAYSMATTLSFNNVSPEEYEKLKNKPGFKVDKINYETIPGSSTTVTKHIENKEFGLWNALADADDGALVLTSAGADALYDDPQYKVAGPFGLPTNLSGDSVKEGAGTADCDETGFAGDPWTYSKDANSWVATDPDAGFYTLSQGGDSTFNYNLTQGVGRIVNQDGQLQKAAKGYYGTFSIDGQTHKLAAQDGVWEYTKPDGTTTILPAGQPFSLKDSAGNEWVKLGVMDAFGAGENGATEKRSFLEIKSPPSQAVKEQLLAEGISPSEIIAKGSRTQRLELGLRLPGGIGDTAEQGVGSKYTDNDDDAYVGSDASLSDKKILYSKTAVCPYFDAHFKTCEPQGNFVKTTQDCDTTKIVSYNISYDDQKDCNDTLYDVQKTEKVPDTETKQVTFCKDKVVTNQTAKFDACAPEVPATYKTIKCFDLTKTKEEKGYNLIKEDICPNWEVSGSTPGVTGKCVTNDYWASPLALDLDGNGVTTSDTNWNFDLDGTGVKTWKGSLDKGDGFLVFDKNNDGIASDGTELFGNITAAGDGDHADGLEALRAYADQYLPGASADGVLNEAEIAQLQNNFNFRVQILDDNGEPQLVTPSSLGITKFNLNPDPNLESFTDDNGVYHNPRTFFTMNGVENTNLDDLWFQQVESDDAAVSTTSTTTTVDSSTEVDDAATTVADKPARPQQDPLPWERNPWLYNNASYGAPPMMPPAPNFGLDPLMMQMMSAMSGLGGMMPNSYGYQQQQQVQMQQQMQAQFYQAIMGVYMQALMASLMPQLSSQQYQPPVPQQQQYNNPFSFY